MSPNLVSKISVCRQSYRSKRFNGSNHLFHNERFYGAKIPETSEKLSQSHFPSKTQLDKGKELFSRSDLLSEYFRIVEKDNLFKSFPSTNILFALLFHFTDDFCRLHTDNLFSRGFTTSAQKVSPIYLAFKK